MIKLLMIGFVLVGTMQSIAQPVFKKMYGTFGIYNFDLIEILGTNNFVLSNHNNKDTDHTFFKINEIGEPFDQSFIYQSIGGSLGGSHRIYKIQDTIFDILGLNLTYINGNPQSVLFLNRRDSSLQTTILSKFYDIKTTIPPGVVSCLNSDSTYVMSGGIIVQPNNMYYPMIIKLNQNLGISWSRSFRDRMGYVQDIVQSPEGGNYLLMHLANEGMALTKTDPIGTVLWCVNYQQPYRYVNNMVQLQDGNLLLAGYKNPSGTGYAPIEIFLTKVDTGGQIIWSKTYGDNQNTFYKAGQTPTFYVDTANNHSIILTGIFKRQFHTYTDLVGVLLDSSGSIIWSRCFGNDYFDEFGSICHQTSDGGFILGGYNNYQINDFPPVQNKANVTVIKTDSLGISDGCMEYPVTIYSEPDTPLVTILTWSIYMDSIVTEIPSNMVDTTGTPTRNENMCTFVSLMEMENSIMTIEVYPNPATGIFTVQSELFINSVRILDVTGREVFLEDGLNRQKLEVNFQNHPPGMYFVMVLTEKSSATMKLVIN